MLGADLSGGVVVAERVRDLQVQARPSQRRDVVDHDLAHERVREPKHPGLIGHRHQQPMNDRRVKGVEAGVELDRGGCREQREVDVAADHGGELEDLPGHVGQQRDPAPHDVAHARRHVGGPDRVRAREQPRELRGEERIAVGAFVDGAREVGVGLRPGRLRNECSRRAGVDATQAEPARGREAGHRGQRLHDRVVAADLEFSHRGHDEQRQIGDPAR